MNRRQFLVQSTAWVAGASGLLLPDVAAARSEDFWYKDRVLVMRRAQTGEFAQIRFYESGRYMPEAYRQLCYMMRDVVDRNSVVSMDIGLFNVLYGIQEWARMAGISNPVLTTSSGYRTPAHNANTEGAAKNSLHLSGQAADVKVRGLSPNQVGLMAAYYKVGGVGYYDSFTHVDTGRVRHWRG